MFLNKKDLILGKQTWIGLFVTLVFALAWLGSTASAAGGSTYYVATNGNNANNGTQGQPLKTIQKAVDLAQPGDTIYVRGGTYNEAVSVIKSGTAQQPIRLYAFPGEQPVIDGRYSLPTGTIAGCSNVSPKNCFVYTPLVLLKGSYLEFSGFKIIRSQGRGIGVTSSAGVQSRNIVIDSCTIDGTRNAAINIQDAAYVTIQNCDISHGADFATHSRASSELNWPVIVNIIRSNQVIVRKSKIYESWGEGIAAGRDATNVTIEDNIIYDNFALQVYLHRSQDVLLQRNLIYHTNASNFRRGGSPSSCVVVNNESNFMSSLLTARLKIINNVVTGCVQGIAIWGNAGTNVLTQDIEIANNVVANAVTNTSKDPVGIFVSPKANLKNIIVRQNIGLQNGGVAAYIPNSSQVKVSNNVWSSAIKGGATGQGDKIADPQLSDPNRQLTAGGVQVDWFKPKNNSPAIALGAGPYAYPNQSVAVAPPRIPATPTPPAGPTPSPANPTPTPATAPGTAASPQALYHFNENGGGVIHDVSNNAERIDLTIGDPSAVQWSSTGLTIIKPVMIRSTKPVNRLVNACRASNAFSLEAWITPANVSQDGPARIVSLSGDPNNRNFTLGQGLWGSKPKDVYGMRLRTTQTDANGEPALVSSRGVVQTSKTHIFYVRQSNGTTQLYVDGTKVASGSVKGQLSGWDGAYSLLLGNEASGDRPWLGTFHKLAIYCQAVSPSNTSDVRTLLVDADTNTETADIETIDYAIDPLDAPEPSPDDLEVSVAELDAWQAENGTIPAELNLQPGIYLPFVSQ